MTSIAKPVGVIANPASGRDIRRLISSADAAPISDKVSILVRMVRTLDALGVERALFMPDPQAIGGQVARALGGDLASTSVEILALERPQGNFLDSIRSADPKRDRKTVRLLPLSYLRHQLRGRPGRSLLIEHDATTFPVTRRAALRTAPVLTIS